MEQLVLLLVIAAISLVNWLIERSGKLREQRRREKDAAQRGEPPPTAATTSFPETSAPGEIEEQMRRVFESFGFPVEDPKPLLPHQSAPFQIETSPSLPPVPQPASPMEQNRTRRRKEVTPVFRERSPWLKRLESPQGLREAVVLREILGPPKSLCEP